MTAEKILLEEHKLILKAVEFSKKILEIENDSDFHSMSKEIILFFRNYTEVYHHPKEEDVLYPLLQKRVNSNASNELLKEISDNHEDFKSLMAEIENAYCQYDYNRLRTVFKKYISYQEDHIKRENKLILNSLNKHLNSDDMKFLEEKFLTLDNKHGEKNQLVEDFYKQSLNYTH